MSWSRVLVTTDLSPESARAAATCLDLPGRPVLLLVHVGRADPRLAEEAARLRGLGALVEHRTIEQGERTIANVVLETAIAEGADLVAIGARGRGRAVDRLLGSVSDAILRRARTDVMIVRGALSGPLLERVLVATDLSPTSLEIADRLAETRAVADGMLVHVDTAVPAVLRTFASARGWRALERHGAVVGGVVEAALEERATLIALSRVGGADALAGVSLGSVAEGVAFAAPCPVLVATPRDIPTLTVRELASAEYSLADEVWRDYHDTHGNPAVDRIFGLFVDGILASLARCRRHPDGYEVDAVFTPAPFRGRGYARHVMTGLVEACHNEPLAMYAVAGLERFYGTFGFVPIPNTGLPGSVRTRYDWAAGDMTAAGVTPMLRPAGWYARHGRDRSATRSSPGTSA